MPSIEVIWGVTTDGRSVTLFDSTISNSRIGSSGYPTQSFRSNFVMIGAHYISAESLRTKGATLNYTYLRDWYGRSGFTWKRPSSYPSDEPVVLTYKHPDDVIAHTKYAGFVISASLNARFDAFNPSMMQTVSLRIESQSNLGISEWLEQFITPIQNLLSLATNHPNSLTIFDLDTPLSTNKDELSKKRTNILFNPVFFEEREDKEMRSNDMLFSLLDVADLNTLLSNWFMLYEKWKSALNLFFGGIYYPPKYMDGKFIDKIQTIEVFYIHMLNDYLPKISGNLTRKALSHLFTLSEDIMLPLVGNKSHFLSLVVNARNYYAHYQHSDNIKNKGDIYWLNEALTIVSSP